MKAKVPLSRRCDDQVRLSVSLHSRVHVPGQNGRLLIYAHAIAIEAGGEERRAVNFTEDACAAGRVVKC